MNGDAEFSFKILLWTDVEESSLKSGQSHLAPNYVLTHSGQKIISTNFGINLLQYWQNHNREEHDFVAKGDFNFISYLQILIAIK
jgi:hypothetical protein